MAISKESNQISDGQLESQKTYTTIRSRISLKTKYFKRIRDKISIC